MADMARVQTIMRYLATYITEQTLGDLVQPDRYGNIWGGRDIPIIGVAARDMAARMTGDYAADVFFKGPSEFADMVLAFELLGKLYFEIYEQASQRPQYTTMVEGITRFVARLHMDAKAFEDIDLLDEQALLGQFGTHVPIAGIEIDVASFVREIAPLLKEMGFDRFASMMNGSSALSKPSRQLS
jgi:hypothetical protein